MNQQVRTVYIVDDHEGSRNSVLAMMKSMKTPSAAFESAEHFLEVYRGEPGCLVSDLRMPGLNAIELIQELQKRNYQLPTIIISAYAEVPVAVEAMQHGALSLLEKPYRENELWSAVRTALKQDSELRDKAAELNKVKNRFEKLTGQEQDILSMIVDGLPNKSIAYRLDMGLRTIESRRKSIFQKMHVDCVAQLVQQVMIAKDDQQPNE